MKSNIHPQYKELLVQFPNGDTFKTRSTCGQDKLNLDVDFRKHPAWTKKGMSEANASSLKVAAFNKKFGNIQFSVSQTSKNTDKNAEKSPDKDSDSTKK